MLDRNKVANFVEFLTDLCIAAEDVVENSATMMWRDGMLFVPAELIERLDAALGALRPEATDG